MSTGFRSLTPYLVIDGAAAALLFIRRAFAAEVLLEFPDAAGRLMHSEARIGDSMIELADPGPRYPPMPAGLHLYVPDADAVFARAIDAGAVVLRAMADQPYGDREGSVRDPFGNNWYIATHKAGGHWAPPRFHSLTPYLTVNGAAGLIAFLKTAFDAEEMERHDGPGGSVVHAAMRMGDSPMELSDANEDFGPLPGTLHFYVKDTDQAFRRAVEAGATVIEEPKDQSYGDRSAAVVDPFGNRWFLATHLTQTAD